MKKRTFHKRNQEVIHLRKVNEQLRESINYYRERWFDSRSENKRLVRKLRGDDNKQNQTFEPEFSFKYHV